MARRRLFSIAYDPEVAEHLRAIEKKHHSLIRDTIQEQLAFEPESEARNRKPLRQPAVFDATWELRLGPANSFRVLYAVDLERSEVQVLAIGVKVKNALIIAGKAVLI